MIWLQFKIGFAVALSCFILPVECVRQAWTPPILASSKPYPEGTGGSGPYRPMVDQWRWTWLNRWYSNVEDGVSGQQAWVWSNGHLVPYPSLFKYKARWWVALCWNARNSANNLKRPLRKDAWLANPN